MEIGKWIKRKRIENGIRAEQIVEGICSVAELKNFENGKREPEVFVQMRILERLGCNMDRVQFVLREKDYQCAMHRNHILYSIMKGKTEKAYEQLEKFELEDTGKSQIQRQFALRMRAFLQMIEGRSEIEISRTVIEALECTVPHFEEQGYRKYILSVQEIELLTDVYVFQNASEQCFREIHNYISTGKYDVQQKAWLYPKVVWNMVNAAQKGLPMEKWDAKKLLEYYEKVTEALESLRANACGQYMREMLLLRETVIKVLITKWNLKEEYGEIEKQNARWLMAVEKLYQTAEMKKMPRELYLLYAIRNAEGLSQMLTNRMEMLNVSSVQLAEKVGVDVRTVRRMRQGKNCPQKQIAQDMMAQLGLPQTYYKQSFLGKSEEDKALIEKLINCENNGLEKETKELLEKLHNQLDMDILFNRREYRWHKLWTGYFAGEIMQDEYLKETREIIEECFSLDCAWKKGRRYFSYNELSYLFGYLQVVAPEKEFAKELIRGLERYAAMIMESHQILNYSQITGMMIQIIQSVYGNKGKFIISNAYCKKWMKEYLELGSIRLAESFVYAMWWNQKEKTKTTDSYMLSWLKDVANLIYERSAEDFYQRKMEELD